MCARIRGPSRARGLPSFARNVILLSLLPIFLLGCARPAGEIFPRADPPVVFPPPPDQPRIRFVGQLATDSDLKPALTGWQAFAAAVGGPPPSQSVSTPLGVTVSADEKVYVADPALHCVHVFDLRARHYAAITDAGDQSLATPAAVAVGGDEIFVTDSALHAVMVFDRAGRYRRRIGEDCLKRPVGIALASHGVDQSVAASRIVGSAVRTGSATDSMGEPGPHSGPDLFVVDTGAHDCVIFDSQGHLRKRFGRLGTGPGEFNYPTAVATHPRTGVVIADTLNFRVQRFDFDGKFLNAIGTRGDGAGDFALPKGVAVDPAGRIYVVDAQFENVQVFTPEGQLLLAFGEEGRGPGQFWLPGQAFVGLDNRLWIADSYNRRVQVFDILADKTP